MAFAWKQAGLTYNRYLAVAARVVRRSLKEGPRFQADRRGEMELRFAKWEKVNSAVMYHLRFANDAQLSQLSLNDKDEAPPPPNPLLESSPRNIPPSGNSVPSQDITKDFKKASKALRVGKVVKDESFTLFEAVGALEMCSPLAEKDTKIMDPKMDSGYLANGETLEDDYDVLHELLPEEVIGIMDQLLCFEMAWHMGFPLSQSLLTSYYIDRLLWPEPKSLGEARFDRDKEPANGNQLLHVVLRAYCLSLIKTCDFVHRRLATEKFFEEEDFVSHLFHRNLLTDFALAEIQDILYEAIKFIERDLQSKNDTLKEALQARLSLRQLLLHATNVDGIVYNHKDRYHFWDQCLPLIPGIVKTNTLALSTRDSYSIKVQRRLATTTPPRPIVQTNFAEAIEFLERMCLGGRDVYQAMNYHGPINLQNFVWAFQSRTPQPPVYIRSLLQSLIWSDMKVLGKTSFKQLIFDDLEETVLAASILTDPENDQVEAPHHARFKISQEMDEFAFLDIYVTLCMNRSRLRRMLSHLVLEWETIQLEAENIDVEMRRYSGEVPGYDKVTAQYFWSYPLSRWACHHKLRIMQWIVQMGFELDIYQVDEMAGMYWYLQHVTNARLEEIREMRSYTMIRADNMPRATKKEKFTLSRAKSYLSYAEVETSALKCFADGLSCVSPTFKTLCTAESLTRRAKPTLRYQLRMKPFAPISHPPVPSFDQFMVLVSLRSPATTASEVSEVLEADRLEQALGILEVAESALKEARKKWEFVSKADADVAKYVNCEEWWRVCVKNVLRSCIAANVSIATAKKAMENENGRNLEVGKKLKVEIQESGKNYHAWWIVPKITAK
ncbi:MAG: hypothetical protein Q9217_006342 [Psora testacea]